MAPSTDRQQYRALVADVAARAMAILPQAVNGRVEKAVTLVLQGDVQPQDDGTIPVYSATDATRRYVLQGTSCTCADYERGQAPQGWCCHRIAAGIHKRVGELLLQSTAVETEPTGQPLPEAPASANCHITIEGRQVQLTLRDTDEGRLLQRLQDVLARYPAPASPPVSSQVPDTAPLCPAHGPLKKSTRGKGWYCAHKLDDGSWCPSKGK